MSFLRTAVRPFKRALYPLTSLLLPRATLIRGVLAPGDDPVCVLLVGDGWLLRTVTGLFAGPVAEVWRTRVPLPLLRSFLRRRGESFGIAFMSPSPMRWRLFGPSLSHEGRDQVRQVLDLSGGWQQIRSRFSRRLREGTNDFERKRGLACRISRSAEDFDHFYLRMYLPHARARFAELAYLASRDTLRSSFEQGFLLMVEQQGRAIAAALCDVRGDTLVFSKSGVLDGDPSHLRAGAEVAIYYFMIRYALQLGLRELDCGRGQPFLSDGVVQHKSLWGARLRESGRDEQVFLVAVGKDRAAARDFLSRHPIVVSGLQGLDVLAASRATSDAEARDELRNLRTRWRKLGLERAELLGPDGWQVHELRGPAGDA